MTENHMGTGLVDETFVFLKKVLTAGDKVTAFQPRGPKEFSNGSWKYECELEGSIDKFSGQEFISYENKIVFTHEFFGGTVISN